MNPGWSLAARGYQLKSAGIPNNAVPVQPATGSPGGWGRAGQGLGMVAGGLGIASGGAEIADSYRGFTDKTHANYNNPWSNTAGAAAGAVFAGDSAIRMAGKKGLELGGAIGGKTLARAVPFGYVPFGWKATAEASDKGKWFDMAGEAAGTMASLIPGWGLPLSMVASGLGREAQSRWDAANPADAGPMDYWQEQEARANGTYPGMANSPANKAKSTSWFGGDDKPADTSAKDKEDVLAMFQNIMTGGGGAQQPQALDARWTPGAAANTSWRRLSGMQA